MSSCRASLKLTSQFLKREFQAMLDLSSEDGKKHRLQEPRQRLGWKLYNKPEHLKKVRFGKKNYYNSNYSDVFYAQRDIIVDEYDPRFDDNQEESFV